MARKRHDPIATPADGRRSRDALVNRDPNRHYVYANPNDEQVGVSYYEGLGYVIETAQEGGVRAVAGKRVSAGQPIMQLGQVLMSCPLDEHLEREADGQALIDAVERRIVKQGNIEDGLRGQGFQLGVDQRETGGFGAGRGA